MDREALLSLLAFRELAECSLFLLFFHENGCRKVFELFFCRGKDYWFGRRIREDIDEYVDRG